jgi:hypothetical protein
VPRSGGATSPSRDPGRTVSPGRSAAGPARGRRAG